MNNTLKKVAVLFLGLTGLATANITLDDQKTAVRAASAAYHKSNNVADDKYVADSIRDFKDNGWEVKFFNTYPQSSIVQLEDINTNSREHMKNMNLEQFKQDNQVQLNAIEKNNLGSFLVRTQVFVAKKNNQVIISFRGSDDWSNWLVDSYAFQADFEKTGVGVHAGFYMYLIEAVKDDEAFSAWFAENVNQETNITITGHSLGAGVSVLMDAYLIEQGFSKDHIKLITFAEPAAGNMDFAQKYQAEFKNYVWNVNYADPVVWITETVDFHHFGVMNGFHNTSATWVTHSLENYYNQTILI